MLDLEKLDSLEYVVNGAGRKTAVIVAVNDFQQLLEDLHDLAAIAERREEPTISHEELVAALRRDGLLPD